MVVEYSVVDYSRYMYIYGHYRILTLYSIIIVLYELIIILYSCYVTFERRKNICTFVAIHIRGTCEIKICHNLIRKFTYVLSTLGY